MRNKIVAVALCSVLAVFVIVLRLYIISLPGLQALTQEEVYRELETKIIESIEKQFPEFPQEKKNDLIRRAYQQYLQENKYVIEENIQRKTRQKQDFFRNENGHTYMASVDSYYWLRLMRNLITKGHIGEKVLNGRQYDDLAGTFIEDSLSRSMHLFAGKWLYGLYGLLGIKADYEAGLYVIPIALSVIMVLVAFFVTRVLSSSNYAGFFAALAVNCSPLFLSRTIGEWLDTDIYNVFFPLLIFSSFVLVFKSKSLKVKAASVAAFALFCGFYASIWQGWWFIFDLLILCGLVFFLNDYYSEHKDKAVLKHDMIWLSVCFVAGCLFVGVLNGRESFLSFIAEPGRLVFALRSVPQGNWPNVFLTVAELKGVSAYQIADQLGGVPLFFFTILGSIYLILVKKIMRDRKLGIGFFCLFIWLGLMYYAALNAIRFALLLVVPLGILFGIVFDHCVFGALQLCRRFPKKIELAALAVLVCAVAGVVFFYFSNSMKMMEYRLPLMNDAWQKSLTFIKDDSGEEAIINSWWDYGHWFTAIAQRRVLFDGKTQNSPIAYWVARSLLTDDENESLGIMRMLDASRNKAFDLLRSSGVSHTRSIELLRQLVRFDEAGARVYLKDIVSAQTIEKLMPLLYSDALPAAYCIVSYDMLPKINAVSFIGNWDFEKGDMWIAFKEKRPMAFMQYLKTQYGYDNDKAKRVFNEISHFNEKDAPSWITKVDGISQGSFSDTFTRDGSLLFFNNGVVVDLKDNRVHAFVGRNKPIGIPHSIVYVNDGMMVEKVFSDSTMPHSLLLLNKKKDDGTDSYQTIFVAKDLARSMFVRLYFFDGVGLRHFTKLKEEKTLEGNSIFIYKIHW